ncbi:MAG: response regulator [Chloroflexota bacterium]
MANKSDLETRHLNLPDNERPRSLRATTGPLEEELPWVIEFRVVGTAAMIQAQVHEAMIIGRSDPLTGVYPDVDLGPHGAQSNGVSRQHAAVIAKDNRIKIKDLGSINGTKLNGFALEANQEYRLRHGDSIEIGQLKLQVRFAVVPTIEQVAPETKSDHASIPILGTGQHILIVEDDADVGKVFDMTLAHAGFRITVVESAVAALGLITHEMPDAIVLDLMLPDMNGLDLVRYVRKQENGQDVPMIVCSGSTGGFHANKAKDAGANMFLGKPISVEELVKAIGSVIKPTADAVSL